jgi:hypothetical protein
VASFFAEEVTRLHKVVARHAVLELNPGPGVSVTNVVGRPSTAKNRGVVVQLGDLSLGEQAEVVVELASTAPKNGANVEVLDAVLRYDDGVGGGPHEERVFVGARATEDAASIAQGRAKTVEDALARAKDAATTLQRIEAQRNLTNANQKRPTPAPVVAPPRRMDLTTNGATPMPAAPAEATTPEQLRKAHDQAMKNFQAF